MKGGGGPTNIKPTERYTAIRQKEDTSMARYSKAAYEEIATVLCVSRDLHSSMDTLIKRFADLFEKDNPMFDRQRFVNAANRVPLYGIKEDSRPIKPV